MDNFNGLTVSDRCAAELAEIGYMLNCYNVSKEDAEAIKGDVREVYFQLHKAYAGARALERILEDELGYKDIPPRDIFAKYVTYVAEEENRYPFLEDETFSEDEEDELNSSEESEPETWSDSEEYKVLHFPNRRDSPRKED